MGELGDDFETAFYAVSGAYISSAEQVAKCNARLDTATKQIEEKERLYDNLKK